MKRNFFFFRVHLPARYEGNILNKFMLKLLFVYGSIITYMYHGCLKFHFFSWLITPFRDNGHLTAQQRRFNQALSSIQQKIERAISLLKGRRRKLLLLDHLDLELEVYIIVAACVLHNFCLLHDDFDDGYLHDGLDDNDDDPGHHPADGRAEAKRTHLMNTVCP